MNKQSRSTRNTKNHSNRPSTKESRPSGIKLRTPKTVLVNKESPLHPDAGKEAMKTKNQLVVTKPSNTAITKPQAAKLSKEIAALHAQLDPVDEAAVVDRITTSMRDMGQRHAILMYGDTVVDGVKRLAACEALGIEPKVEQVPKDSDLVKIWVSENMARKDLKPNEKALLANKIYELRSYLKDENGKAPTKESICKQLGTSVESADRIRDAFAISKLLGLEAETKEKIARGDSPSNVKQTLEDKLAAKVNEERYGQTNLSLAHELHQMGEEGRNFSFLYADPPWDKAIRHTPYQTMPTGHAGDVPNEDGSYPSICAMGKDVKKAASKNAVIWLWTTNSLIPEGLEVLRGWGFEYKTSIVWVKQKTGESRGAVLPKHELILVGRMRGEDGDVGEDQDIVLVGRRGHGANNHDNHIASIQEFVPGEKVHSRKPEEFAKLAEDLYPDAVKLELFARQPRDGWATWGNQSDGEAVKELTREARKEAHHEHKEAKRGAKAHRKSAGKRAGKGGAV